MIVTVFKDIKDTSTPFYRDIEVVFERIRSGNSKAILDSIALEQDEASTEAHRIIYDIVSPASGEKQYLWNTK